MLSEQWIKLNQTQCLAQSYNVEKIVHSIDKFEIFFAADVLNLQGKIWITFEEGIFSYRHTKVCFRKKTLKALCEQNGQGFLEWPFFKVNDSSYIQWLIKQSGGIFSAGDFVHFAFVTRDSLLEVIVSKGSDPLIKHV